MQKIVINRRFGGFGLSEQGIKAYAERKGLTLYPEVGQFSLTNYWTVPPDQRPPEPKGKWSQFPEEYRAFNEAYNKFVLSDREIPRDDADLVAVVEQLGAAADGRFAGLHVVTVPDGVQWEIEEYDGMEHIAEVHRTWA